MQIRQMTVRDWVEEFERNVKAEAQIKLIQDRIDGGLKLATWEQNCLKAWKQLTQGR